MFGRRIYHRENENHSKMVAIERREELHNLLPKIAKESSEE